MEQSVIRVSSFTHTVASATPHATFLDSASLHPGYNSKAHPYAPYFQRRSYEGLGFFPLKNFVFFARVSSKVFAVCANLPIVLLTVSVKKKPHRGGAEGAEHGIFD
jgi:hypothetical protein